MMSKKTYFVYLTFPCSSKEAQFLLQQIKSLFQHIINNKKSKQFCSDSPFWDFFPKIFLCRFSLSGYRWLRIFRDVKSCSGLKQLHLRPTFHFTNSVFVQNCLSAHVTVNTRNFLFSLTHPKTPNLSKKPSANKYENNRELCSKTMSDFFLKMKKPSKKASRLFIHPHAVGI